MEAVRTCSCLLTPSLRVRLSSSFQALTEIVHPPVAFFLCSPHSLPCICLSIVSECLLTPSISLSPSFFPFSIPILTFFPLSVCPSFIPPASPVRSLCLSQRKFLSRDVISPLMVILVLLGPTLGQVFHVLSCHISIHSDCCFEVLSVVIMIMSFLRSCLPTSIPTSACQP